MLPQRHAFTRRWAATTVCGALWAASLACAASDHLDTRTVVEDPRADIGDLYAWTSADGKRLNLVMAIVGHRFSDELVYTFHVDSGARFSHTTASTAITCRFPAAHEADCTVGDVDSVRGDAARRRASKAATGGSACSPDCATIRSSTTSRARAMPTRSPQPH